MLLTARIAAAGLVAALTAGLVAPVATAAPHPADRRAPRPMLSSVSDQVVAGQKLVLKGAVAPAAKGVTVILQKRVAGKKWVEETRLRTNHNGGFTYRDKPHVAGARSYRAVVPGGGRSKPVTVTVYRWQSLTDVAIRSSSYTYKDRSASINGHRYARVVHGYNQSQLAEGYADWNLGRQCLKLRTAAGLGDASDAAAGATVTLTGDSTQLYTQSFTLGQSATTTADVTGVFRLTFGWTAANPLANTQPMLGDPEVLCAF